VTPFSDRYRIVNKVADGSLCEVFLAEGPDKKKVAVKILRRELIGNAEAVGRCLDEAEACKGFDHPNLIRVIEAGRVSDGRVYMVTEFLEGEDLAAHLRLKGRLSPGDLVRLALLTCQGLAHAHQRKVIHRDLKPENIFLVGGLTAMTPKIIDFGLAHFRGNKSVKTAGVLVSTPEYAAPEVISGQLADARSDLYALGVIMYECLTGSPPFVATSYGELLLKHLNDPPPTMLGVHAALRSVIERCLAKKPEERFQTALEVAAALRAALDADAQRMGALDRTHVPVSQSGMEQLSNEASDQLFGSYRLMKALGEGAMGQVFLAQHVRLGRQVAIKVLRPELAGNKDLIARFFQEARAVNEINHEHIVEIFDFVEEPSRVYTVMELLVGSTLADGLKSDGPPSLRRSTSILQQVCKALAAAHQVGVVHRDVKPDNIFLIERSGQRDYVKVLDFGVAKLSRPYEGSSTQKTMQGTILGTPRYMSPEQAGGQDVDHRSDIYAVGTILYELLSGTVPFDGNSFGELAVKLITQKPAKLPDETPTGEKIPAELRQLVAKCLEKDPNRRPQTTMEVADALAPFAGSGLTGEASINVKPRRRGLAVAAVLVFAVVAGSVGWLLAGPQSGAQAQSSETQAKSPPLPTPTPAPAAPDEVKLTIESEPSNASVRRLDTNEIVGATPIAIAVRRGKPVQVQATLDGYGPAKEELSAESDTTTKLVLSPLPALTPPPVAAKQPPATAKKKPKNKPRTFDQDDIIDPFSTR
jgi:eukaryotic-like serine/threonine-protein kinase